MKTIVEFVHRKNPDSTIDSICMKCYLTVATATAEDDLSAAESKHNCAARDEWYRLDGTTN